MTVPSIERTRKLEGLLNALRSVLALQSGRGAPSGEHVLGRIADLLLRTLDLQFVFARVGSKATGAGCDVVRLDRRRYSVRLSEGLTAALEPWLSPGGCPRSRLRHQPLGPRSLAVATFAFGSPGVNGKLIVGAARAGFPSDIENLLLRVAANQASVASNGLIETGDLSAVAAAIVQNCSDFIGIATLGGRAVFVNSAGRRMVGLEDHEPIPDNIAAYVAEGQQDRLLNQALPVVEREGFWEGEMHFHHIPTGRIIPVLQHIFYIKEPDTGRRLALATISRDMTERKRAELALNNAQQELAHASRCLSIGELTASLAHEINQPLAAIVANANACRRWLERKVPDYEHARKSLQNIARDGNRASAILQRVREFAAKAPPSRVPLNLNAVVREVLGIVTNEIAREQITLRVELAAKLPDIVADRIELQQVVLNLIINSIEALRPLSGRRKELAVTSVRRRSAVEVAVRDTGNGSGAQNLECLFDAFFTTKPDGMGLGLAISRRIIEAHSGKLWAVANPGGGLTLRFTLPARGPARSPAKRPPP